MVDWFVRGVSDLVARLHGPFSFRFVLQPAMAAIYALHDGLRDAREGKPAYLWSLLTKRVDRPELLRQGLHRMARVIMLGTVVDVLYQLIEFRWVYPLELVVTVFGIAFVPYLLLRGVVRRMFGHMRLPG